MTLTVVVVLTSRAMKLRKTVHVKKKKKEQLDATKRVKPIPKVLRRIDRLAVRIKDSVKVGNAIKAKEVGIGWPWVTCTGELPNIQRENVTIFAPPPLMEAVTDDLLVGPFISEFCSMPTMVLHKCVSSIVVPTKANQVLLIQAAKVMENGTPSHQDGGEPP